jgi:predicted nuclease of predicted toxin-antitoxin system
MKFLADVKIDRRVIDRLRADGHDVLWIADINPELDDISLLRLAWREEAIILTNDKDFQRHVFRENHQTHGLIWLRLGPGLVRMPRTQQIERALQAIRAFQDRLSGQVTAIYPDRVEQESISIHSRRESEQSEHDM